jgi:hypothetical protein
VIVQDQKPKQDTGLAENGNIYNKEYKMKKTLGSQIAAMRSKILNEDFAKDAEDIMGKDLAGAVADLKSKAGDKEFQKGATAGHDDGAEDDEKVASSTKPVPATKMFPTQAEIGFGNSLDDLVADKYEQIDNAFNTPVEMSSPSGKSPILVADIGGEIAILDGHHRWSLCFMINPDAEMNCDILKGDFDTPEDALKAMQFAIAAKAGKVKTKGFEGKDLMSVSTEEVEQYVEENLVKSAVMKFAKYKPEIFEKAGMKAPNSGRDAGREKPRQAIAKYIGNTHKKIVKMKGLFTRNIMPQADFSGAPQDTVNTALAKGDINFNKPYVKENSLRETFQYRAGIKK